MKSGTILRGVKAGMAAVLLFSAVCAAESAGRNLLEHYNPGFEAEPDGLLNWDIRGTASELVEGEPGKEVRSGKRALRIYSREDVKVSTVVLNAARIYVEPGQKLNLSIWARGKGRLNPRFTLQSFDEEWGRWCGYAQAYIKNHSFRIDLTENWKEHRFSYVVEDGVERVTFHVVVPPVTLMAEMHPSLFADWEAVIDDVSITLAEQGAE